MLSFMRIAVFVMAASAFAGCSHPPTRQQIGTATGAVVGAGAGAVIGSEVGKSLDKKR